MKKSIKRLITVFAVCAVSAFAAMASGCGFTDKIKDKIEQARCEHEWNDGEVTKAATCTEVGELTKTCTLCEKVETEEIELVDHIAVYVQAVTPTCLEKGLTDGTVCSVCETKISGFQEIPALGHIVVKDSAVKATCLETGLTAGEHCSRCDEVLVQQAIVPATGHNLVILEAVEPTCSTEGKTQGVWCDKCEVVFTAQEPIEKLEHTDESGDDICDICAVSITLANASEVAFDSSVFESGWYRVYRNATQTNKVSFEICAVPVGGLDSYDTYSIYFSIASTMDDNGGYDLSIEGYTVSVNNVEVFATEEYVDFYIPEIIEIGDSSYDVSEEGLSWRTYNTESWTCSLEEIFKLQLN